MNLIHLQITRVEELYSLPFHINVQNSWFLLHVMNAKSGVDRTYRVFGKPFLCVTLFAQLHGSLN